ncbi:fluoride efflux transporter CrcB [Methylobacterium oxalidis]|uniref:fluoride efflux transporter CrcB n=1 Tax=Methylobacterium oxalidis TaxID=944322 RepID=UPI00331531DD
MNFLLVFLGAGLGGVARHGVNLAALRLGSDFPVGTLVINVLGSVLMGVLTGWFALRGGAMGARLFLATGVLGGFTTFSTYSLEAVTLLERGAVGPALAYTLGSVLLGLGGLFLGLLAMRAIL